jgi:hypothetical protein
MKYQVMLCGENFELNIDGRVQNYGFVTTRWVKAQCKKEAELFAIQLIKNDKSLINLMVDNSTLSPTIHLEDIRVAKWWKKLGGKGYSFYNMSQDG